MSKEEIFLFLTFNMIYYLMGKTSRKKWALTDENRVKETGSQNSVRQKTEEDFQKPATKSTPLLPIFIILAASFTVYFNTLSNDFVYDDMTQVLENPWIRDMKHLPDIFSKSVWSFLGNFVSNYYRPLMHIIYMVNYHFLGLKPWGFHLVNILFHVGNSVLVFLVASRLLNNSFSSVLTSSSSASNLNPPSSNIVPTSTLTSTFLGPPFVAALLFAVHPIHTEAVAWVAGLPDLSFTFFYLLSFYFYMTSTTEKQVHTWRYSLSIVSFSLAALCKEPALTLPIILVLYDLTDRRDKNGFPVHFRRYVPYLIVAAVYLILRSHALGSFAPVMPYKKLATYEYI